MVDPTQQRGDTGRPMRPEPEKEEQVDPEKFKKVLKVEEVDPSEKRQQRRLKKGEEEGDEDEDVEAKAPPPPSSSFAEFMEDKSELDGLFDSEGGVRKRAAPQTSKAAPEPGSISTEGVEVGEEQSSAAPQAQPAPSPYEPQTPSAGEPPAEQPPPSAPPSEQAPSYGQGEEEFPQYAAPSAQYPQGEQQPTDQTAYTTEQPQTQPPTEASQEGKDEGSPKKKEEDASLLASQPAKDALKSKKKAPAKPAPRIETVAPEEKPQTPTAEDAAPEQPVVKGEEPQQPFPQAGEESVMPTFMGAQPPTGAEKGEKLAEQPLQAPMEGEAKPPLEKPRVPTPTEEETGEVSPEGIKKKETVVPTEIPAQAPPRTRPQTAVTFERYTPEQIRNKKMGKPATLPGAAATEEGLVAPPIPEEEMGMMGDQKKKDDFPFIDAEQLTANLPPVEQPFAPVVPPTDAPPYSQLSPQTYELFEKMVGTILVQTHSGVTSTTVTLNMPNSVFNGAQVILDQYSTAPQAYNLQLVGTPQAVEAFNANMADLVAAFKQSEHAFEVNLLKPVLEGKKPLIRRKGAAGGGGGKSKK
ncbi:hypothetical protein [Simkania sp.]|uniref:hypothetical protein n=1 Tax=Simkania sp. TaxID=34094 RepID=UPI003B524276